MKKYAYIRVSSDGQERDGYGLEVQEKEILERYPDAEIVSEASSGAKIRPIFDELVAKLEPGDLLVTAKLDRFCRTVKEGLQYIDTLMAKNVTIHILNLGLIEDSPMGRFIVTVLLAVAELERKQILERTASGKALAKLRPDFKEGRPTIYTPKQINHALSLLNDGISYTEVAAQTGISKSTLQRAKRRA